MSQYNTLNVKLSNWQLNKLKSWMKNGTGIALNFSSNLIGNFNDETNFVHKILLIDTQVLKIRKAFENGWSANIKFSKTQLSKMIQSGKVIRHIPIFENILSIVAKKATDIARNLGRHFMDKYVEEFNK